MESLNDEKRALVGEFLKQEPDISLNNAIKFLYGRKFDLNRAITSYHNYLKTVKEYGFEDVTIDDVAEEMKTRKMYVPGTSALNQSTLFVINGDKHDPDQFPKESTLKLAFYLGDYALSNTDTQQHGITIISNLKGVKWSNFDTEFQRNVISFFSNTLPVSVKNILIYDPPWFVSALVKIISPFLKQKIRERIVVTKDLSKFVDCNALPADVGGNYPFDVEFFIEQERTRMRILRTESARKDRIQLEEKSKFMSDLKNIQESQVESIKEEPEAQQQFSEPKTEEPIIEEKQASPPAERFLERPVTSPKDEKKMTDKAPLPSLVPTVGPATKQEKSESKSFATKLKTDFFSKKEKKQAVKEDEEASPKIGQAQIVSQEFQAFLEDIKEKLEDVSTNIDARKANLTMSTGFPPDPVELTTLPNWKIIRKVEKTEHPDFAFPNIGESLEDYRNRLEESFGDRKQRKRRNRNVVIGRNTDAGIEDMITPTVALNQSENPQKIDLAAKRRTLAIRRQSLRDQLALTPNLPK